MFYSMKNRIRSLIEAIGISQKDFAEELGTSLSYMSSALRIDSTRSLGVDLIVRIKQKWPDLDLNWLLMGVGNMWLSDKPDMQPREVTFNVRECIHCKKKEKMIETLQRSLVLALDDVEQCRKATGVNPDSTPSH